MASTTSNPTRVPGDSDVRRERIRTMLNTVPEVPLYFCFDRGSRGVSEGEQVLALAFPVLTSAAGGPVGGRVAASLNADDDTVAELDGGDDDEIIRSTRPRHVSPRLHVDLPQRIAHLGYGLTTVTAPHLTAGARA